MRHAARTPGMGFLRWAPRMSEGERRAFSRAPSLVVRRVGAGDGRAGHARGAVLAPREGRPARVGEGGGVSGSEAGSARERAGGGVAHGSRFFLFAQRGTHRIGFPALGLRGAALAVGADASERRWASRGGALVRRSVAHPARPPAADRNVHASIAPALGGSGWSVAIDARVEAINGRSALARPRRSGRDRVDRVSGARGAPINNRTPIDPIGEPIPVRPFSAVSTSPIRITKIGEISRSRDLFAEAATLSTRRPRPRARAHCLARRRHLSPAHERC